MLNKQQLENQIDELGGSKHFWKSFAITMTFVYIAILLIEIFSPTYQQGLQDGQERLMEELSSTHQLYGDGQANCTGKIGNLTQYQIDYCTVLSYSNIKTIKEMNMSELEIKEKILSDFNISKFPLKLELSDSCPINGSKTYYSISDIPLEDDCLDKERTSCFIKYNWGMKK